MNRILAFALFVTVVFACSPSNEGGKGTGVPAEAPLGEKVYKTNCITCHGLRGDMGASGAFNLRVSQLTVEERINVITNGRKAMTPFKTILAPEEIKAVAEYTLKLKQ